MKIGIAQSQAEDWPGCIDTYGALLRSDPRHAQALHNLGNVHFRQDRYEEAERYYRLALEAEPDYMLALYHHGWVLRQLNRNDEAVRDLEHCLALPANNPRERRTQLDCRFCLGTLRFRAGDHAGAASLMEQVLAEAPSHLEAHYYLGTAYVRMGRVEEGTRHLELHRQMLRARRRAEPVEKDLEP